MTGNSSKRLAWIAACSLALSLLATPANVCAQDQTPASVAEEHGKGDISGNWQGTLTPPTGKSLRVIVKVAKTDKGFDAKFYSIDQGGQALPVNATTLVGSAVTMKIDLIGGGYSATLSADGSSMVGTWDQGASPIPLTLVRATKETAWEIPAPPPPVKRMPKDADPTFDVSTIKPNDSGNPNMQGLNFGVDSFRTRNSSLVDLICFAYGVQAKQIAGGPEWMSHDRYDITAKPDIEGVPSVPQMRSLVRKLLAERFKLTFHQDKKDMSAYVLTVAKSGLKIKPSEPGAPGPGFGMRPSATGVTVPVFNANMDEFTSFLQVSVLDRPVVNQTGLTDHYDFSIKFMPDDTQFNGHAPEINGQAPKADAADAFPICMRRCRSSSA